LGGAYNGGAIEIKPEQLKTMVVTFFEKLRRLETEIVVYGFAVFIMEKQGIIGRDEWREIISAAKENPALEPIMAEKYDPIVADLLQSIDTSELPSKAEELWRKWQPITKPD
jgi:hypothetical protein